MSTFNVELSRKVVTTEKKTVGVEAATPDEAREKAQALLDGDDGEGWKEDVDLAEFGDAEVGKVTLAAFDDADAEPVE